MRRLSARVSLSTALGAVIGCGASLCAVQLVTASLPAQADTPPWLASDAMQSQLTAGEVVMRSELDQDRASAAAAIRVSAPPQTVWRLITSCAAAATYVPGLKHCQRLQAAPDGSWAIVEHDIRYSPLMPMIHSIVRSRYQPPYRIDFTGVGGNVKAESGSWVLEPAADGKATTVEYSISIEPGFLVPRAAVRYSLSKELPVMLTGLRTQAERVDPMVSLARAR